MEAHNLKEKLNNLSVEYVDINSIKPYQYNSKIHTDGQIEQIKKSIQDYGMNDPIGVWHNEICEGHGRYTACQELGFEEIPIIRLDHLTEEEKRIYSLLHNKLTMNTDFDFDLLQQELDAINTDMSTYGFFSQDFDVESFFGTTQDETPETGMETEKDNGNKVQCPHCGKWFST